MQQEPVNLSSDLIQQPHQHFQIAQDATEKAQGRWDEDQHHRFLIGLFKYGKNWKQIQSFVSTRLCSQVRSHAQKYFIKLQKIIKDRKKQKNKQGVELTQIEKEILQNFDFQDVTPKTPQILVSLLQNSCLVPNSKNNQKNNVNDYQTKHRNQKALKQSMKSKQFENQQIIENQQQLNKIKLGTAEHGESIKNQNIIDQYYEQDESKSFFCRLMENNVQHFRQGRDFTQFIDFIGKHSDQLQNSKNQDLDSAQTRYRRSSFTLVEDQQNDVRLKEAIEKIKLGDKPDKCQNHVK